MKKLNIDPDVLKRMYCDENKSSHEIAKYFDTTPGTVCDYFRAYGIPIKKRKITITKESLEKKYVRQNMSVEKIAKELNVSVVVIYRRLNEYGIDVKGRRVSLPIKELEQKYVKEQKTAAQVADEFGCTRNAVYNNLKCYKIPIRQANNVERVLITKEELIELYEKQGLSSSDIAKKKGCHGATICRKLKKYNIERRNTGTRSKTMMSKETLIRMHHKEKKSAARIARELNCSDVTVWSNLKKYGILVRGRDLKNKLTKKRLQCLYEIEQKSSKEIADIFNCRPETVQKYIRKYGIKPHRDYS